jgi:phosphonate degradation associated HDIG domain protein
MSPPQVSDVLALYERWGRNHYDEELSQLDHALQTAALAAHAGASDALVVAALLHDVGHLLDLDAGRGDVQADLRHEATGAAYLAGTFPPTVTAPIALHVRAKRYRCAVDPAYHDALSDGSTRSLARQGGPLPASEVASFAAHPSFEDAVALRGWDDCGKVEGLDVPPLEHYRELLERVAVTR